MIDFFKGVNPAITVSDKDGNVIYQNDSSIEVNGDARGRNLEQCHNPKSWAMICHMLEANVSNVYTISKKGKKKLIFQTPWYEEGEEGKPAGLVEFSMILPEEMPHFERS
ncbi:MAG: hypothetical protein IKM95_04255 [Bacteroidales bacterium]|jgi:hypothetical protein|nr:hypothetical protein [Bacteroidales bacterium]